MLLTAGVAGGGYGALYEFCTHCCIHVIVRFDLAAYACTSHNSKYAYCPTHSAAPIYHDLNSLSFDSIRLSSPCPLYTNVLLYFCFARLICDAFALRFPHVSLHATRSSHCFSPVQVVAVAAATVATAAKVAAAATAASRAAMAAAAATERRHLPSGATVICCSCVQTPSHIASSVRPKNQLFMGVLDAPALLQSSVTPGTLPPTVCTS